MMPPIFSSLQMQLVFCGIFWICFHLNIITVHATNRAIDLVAATHQSHPHHRPHYDFDKLHGLMKRLDVIEAEAPEMLLGFYDSQFQSFSVKPGGSKKQRVCITSTCYALLTLALGNPGRYDSIVSWDDDIHASSTAKIPIRKAMRNLLIESKWRHDDLFQIPLLLYTVLFLDTDRSLLRSVAQDDELAKKIRTMIVTVLRGRPHRKMGTTQEHSDYIIYQVCKVLALLQTSSTGVRAGHATNSDTDETNKKYGVGGLPKMALPDDVATEIFWGLLRCAEISSNELCRQLAYRTSDDFNAFDVVRLAYSLLTYLRSTESLSGMAGHELEPGQGPAPETKVAPLNKKLVAAALAAFFEEQNADGLWDRGQPIYKSFKEGKGRSIGGAFVFSVNTLGSLLCALPAEDFRPHLREIERTLEWIETHQKLEIISDYVDPETGQCHGMPLRGWTSPHWDDPDAGPMTWSTAQVLKCVAWMSKTIRQLMHNDVLAEFGGIGFSKEGVNTKSWDKLLDSDLSTREGVDRTIKSVLEERVVSPFEKSIDNPSYGAAYSAILFGPPGTAKTSICEALAQRMGYDFLTIDTAAFLADGLTNVAARIRYVFSRLMALDKCVILFDEVEEFALDREAPGISMESRMLTTAMLTAINDLRRVKKSLFFIATNRLKAFDSAITRRGRFDMQLFVGTPNLESRVTQFKQQLMSVASGSIDEEIKNASIRSYRQFLDSIWTEDAMFMNYLEGVQFASACASIVASKNRVLSEKEMAVILKQQAAVMLLRGSAREEYISNMALSRL